MTRDQLWVKEFSIICSWDAASTSLEPGSSVKSLQQHLSLRTMCRRIEHSIERPIEHPIQDGSTGLHTVKEEAQTERLAVSSAVVPHPSPRTVSLSH